MSFLSLRLTHRSVSWPLNAPRGREDTVNPPSPFSTATFPPNSHHRTTLTQHKSKHKTRAQNWRDRRRNTFLPIPLLYRYLQVTNLARTMKNIEHRRVFMCPAAGLPHWDISWERWVSSIFCDVQQKVEGAVSDHMLDISRDILEQTSFGSGQRSCERMMESFFFSKYISVLREEPMLSTLNWEVVVSC